MFCRFCGARVGIGNPHDCPKAPAPPGLRAAPPDTVLGWRLAALAAAAVGLVAGLVTASELADLLRGYLLASAGGSARLHDLQESSATLGLAAAALGFFALLASGVWTRATIRLVERLGEHSAAQPAAAMLTLGRVSALGLLSAAVFAWIGQPKPSDSATTVADADLLNFIVTAVAMVAAVLLVGSAVTSLWRVGKLLVPQPA